MLVDVLINLVRERPALYDPSEPQHRDRDTTAALWMEIANEMELSETDCKEKWHQLRSNFMRERRRINSGRAGKSRKWIFYDSMEFLLPLIAPKETSANGSPQHDSSNIYEDDDDVHDEKLSPGHTRFQGWCTPVMNQPTSTEKFNPNKRRHSETENDTDMQIVDELQKIREQTAARHEDELDPDRQFLLSLLPHMKQLSPAESIDIKIEILQCIRSKVSRNTDT